MVYYFFIALWVGISQLIPRSFFGTKKVSFCILTLMFVLMVTVVLFNPITSDMERYLGVLNLNSNLNWLDAISSVRWEPGFVTYQWLLAQLTTSKIVFIGSSMLYMWVVLIFALKKVVEVKYIPLIMFGYLSFFYFYNFTTNVVRQGFAAPLMIFMLVHLGKNNYKKSIVFFLTALTFHFSFIVVGILFLIKKLNLTVKLLCIIFTVCSILMITGLNQDLMSTIAEVLGGRVEETVLTYSDKANIIAYGSINRIDFLVFTSLWIIWCLWVRYLYLKDDKFYEWLIKCYLALSSMYTLFGFISYSDRLAAYAWFLIPLLLFYPMTRIHSKSRSFWLLISIVISIILFFYFNVGTLYEPIKIFY